MPTPGPSPTGTYVVMLAPETRGPVPIGRLGHLILDGAILAYVGSALGPGGIAARCRHHYRIATRPHWHLDYLRPHCVILGCWVSPGTTRHEHTWARALGATAGAGYPLRGFGASDCGCPAHLVALPSAPTATTLRAILGHGDWWGPHGT